MKTNEILQGNRILAEFMGLKPGYNDYTKKYNWGDGIFFMTEGDTIEKVMDAIVEYAKYHSSWGWIMGVVEKIQQIPSPSENLDLYWDKIQEALIQVNIVLLFSACVEFAKWYKNQAK